jgi:hypothetical protein
MLKKILPLCYESSFKYCLYNIIGPDNLHFSPPTQILETVINLGWSHLIYTLTLQIQDVCCSYHILITIFH